MPRRAVFLLALAALPFSCRVSACGARHPRLWLAGDVNLGDGRAERLTAVTRRLRGAGIVNLEGPVGELDGGPTEARLVNGPQAPAALFDAGVRVAQVVNNHDHDLGQESAARTTAALLDAGVLPASGDPAVLEVDGLKVAVASFDLTRGLPENLAQRLASARAQGGALIATFHVTAPPLLLPEPVLQQAVEVALDAGAVVVAAQGTHQVAPVTLREGAVVAYGLGNFAFACDCTQEEDGLALEVQLSKDGRLEAAWAVPLTAGLKGAAAKLDPEPSLAFSVLDSIGSSPHRRDGPRARLGPPDGGSGPSP